MNFPKFLECIFPVNFRDHIVSMEILQIEGID